MMRWSGGVRLAVAAWLATSAALAEDASAPPPPRALTESTAAPASNQCFPDCRPGYFCYVGRCVSRCNPGCPDGTECTEDLRCAPWAELHQAAPRAAVAPPDVSTMVERPRGRPGDLVLRMNVGPALVFQRGEIAQDGAWFGDGFGEKETLDLHHNMVGQTAEVTLGAVQVRELVYGGSLSQTVAFDGDAGVAVVLLGTFIDYYPVGDFGLHLLADASLGVVHGIADSNRGGLFAFGATLGVGYGFRVSQYWSLGPLLRVQYAASAAPDEERRLLTPSLSFASTYGR